MRSPDLNELWVQPRRVRLPGLVSSSDQISGGTPSFTDASISRVTCGLVQRNSWTVAGHEIVELKSNMANEWCALAGDTPSVPASAKVAAIDARAVRFMSAVPVYFLVGGSQF